MKMRLPLIFALLFTACGRAFDYSGPAPAGALECALAHSVEAGYRLVEGSPAEGWLRLSQPIPPPPAEADPPPPGMVISRPERLGEPIENSLLVRVEDDRLRMSVLGTTEGGEEVGAGQGADAHARTILALCTASPPTPPAETPYRSG